MLKSSPRVAVAGAALLLLLLPSAVLAYPDFAAETGLACGECHTEGADAGPLTDFGREFEAAGYELPESSPEVPAGGVWFRGIVRYVHLVCAVVWFGAIVYIHLFVKPKRLVKGLPRGEMILGWTSIAIMTVTGALLTIWRVGSAGELWTTTFGIVWTAKISAFAVLVAVAAVTTTVLNRGMRRAADEAGGPGACGLVRFVHAGMIYDATGSPHWKDGVHVGRHRAGTDLTEAMADAPHGPEILDRIEKVGPAVGSPEPPLPGAARLFIVFAFANLALVAFILFCVSYWSWGPALVG